MKQLMWLKIIHSGDWCLRLALHTPSGACHKRRRSSGTLLAISPKTFINKLTIQTGRRCGSLAADFVLSDHELHIVELGITCVSEVNTRNISDCDRSNYSWHIFSYISPKLLSTGEWKRIVKAVSRYIQMWATCTLVTCNIVIFAGLESGGL